MKRFWRILGISVGSLIVLLLVVVLVAGHIIFTPKRLTPIVNRIADSVLICPHQLDQVSLTFFRTFPYFGVEVENLLVMNTMPDAQSDTLLWVPELIVGIDLQQALDGNIVVKQCDLHNIEAHLFMNADGTTNIDILRLPTDTTPEDTTASTWQLRSIVLEKPVSVSAKQLSYCSQRDSLSAALRDLDIIVNWQKPEVNLSLDANHISFVLANDTLAQDLRLRLEAPISLYALDSVDLHEVQLSINDLPLTVQGSAAIRTAGYGVDLTLKTQQWPISSILAILPASYAQLLPASVEADGLVQLSAHAYGLYDSTSIPLVDARLQLTDGQGHYDLKVLPYRFDHISADISTHVDFNHKQLTTATIHQLVAHTCQSKVSLQVTAQEIFKSGKDLALANPLLNATIHLDVNLPDARPYIPVDSMHSTSIDGRLTGDIHAHSRLNDITHVSLKAIQAEGDLCVSHMNLIYADSTLANADNLSIRLISPSHSPKKEGGLPASVQIGAKELHAQLLSADIDTHIDEGNFGIDAELDIADSIRITSALASFAIHDLIFDMDTIHAHAVGAKGKVDLATAMQRKNGHKSMPRATVSFDAQELQANMGQWLKGTTDKISIQAQTRYNEKADKVFLRWNPKLSFDLHNGNVQYAPLPLPVELPAITFSYSNRIFQIDTSRIQLGHSDFSLAGEVRNFDKWIRQQDTLQGNLRFISDHADVDELLALVDAITPQSNDTTVAENSTETTAINTQSADSASPYMVPERVNLRLYTLIRQAKAFDQQLQNLGGCIYVKDKQLILEQIGFACDAARLQLSAIYKTPRRNHLFVGFDYHMLDIDLQQLIGMIPQLDTLVPMLKTFRGQAEFHIAAETYLNQYYKVKPSTLRGACSIEGKNLVLLDNETFSTISKILMFNKKTENLVDSISAQITLYKNEVEVFPFCISIDHYMAAVGGHHYANMEFNYHASLLRPIYLGVDVVGNMDKLQIKAAPCRYAKDFRPIIHKDLDTRSAELRQIISSSIKSGVRPELRDL